MNANEVPHYPDISDLVSRIHFAPQQGRIWLDDQRMVLLNSSVLGVLRRELIEGMGSERARGLITRMGYHAGAREAELTRKLRTDLSKVESIYLGAQLHMLEGIVTVEPVHAEIDVERGHLLCEFLWHGSAEDEEHMRLYGIGTEPACWMQIGYASGFASVFMGRPVLFREVQCASQGASHCRIIGKPVDAWDDAEDDLRFLRADRLTSGLAAARDSKSGALLPDAASGNPLLEGQDVVGASAGFNAVCHMVRRVADAQATVLFLGESGVGKEVLARALHRIGPRAKQPFIAINCAAIPENLIEAELFGVEKGAYTGALQNRPGRFERASGGTLFLDEIGILNWTAQGKLLRALQEREIERVGDTQVRRVDVRVVAATNLNLSEEVKAGHFREDLYFRLNVFPIRVPPLRERREDIPIFMNYFLQKFNARNGRRVAGFTQRAIDAMLTYDWPGNIRELENFVERGVILAPDHGAIDTIHILLGDERMNSHVLAIDAQGSLARAAADAGSAAAESRRDQVSRKISSLIVGAADSANDVSLEEIEGLLLQSAVDQTGGNLAAAARILGISRPKLEYRLKNRNSPRAEAAR